MAKELVDRNCCTAKVCETLSVPRSTFYRHRKKCYTHKLLWTVVILKIKYLKETKFLSLLRLIYRTCSFGAIKCDKMEECMSVGLYISNSYKISRLMTREYSTSFYLASLLLDKKRKKAIFAIYGFVRLADEIVDSFHDFDKEFLLDKLDEDLDYALKHKISTNMILTAFVDTVHQYNIDRMHIDSFMRSMKADLTKSEYKTNQDLEQYIYGSADVVGLMCLKIFCLGDESLYHELEYAARKLGSAFQKVNFLRDLREDLQNLGRSYFPGLAERKFDTESKKMIEASIEKDFQESWVGVKHLPGRSKLAVALAYFYFQTLFFKIKNTTPEKVLSKRIRISNFRKYLIIIKVALMYKIRIF